jgi:hypothetical protein
VRSDRSCSPGSGRATAPAPAVGRGLRGDDAPAPPPRPRYTSSPFTGSGTASSAAWTAGDGAEGLPPGVVTELHLENDAPSVLMPFPAGGPGCYRRLDQHGRVGIPPQPGGELAVEYLDRPPLGHTPTISAPGSRRILAMVRTGSWRRLHRGQPIPPAARTRPRRAARRRTWDTEHDHARNRMTRQVTGAERHGFGGHRGKVAAVE